MIWLLTVWNASAGALDAEAALDVFHSASRSAEPLSGPDEVSGTTDVGARLQAELDELDDRFHAELDYRGRQPIAGLAQNRPLHLLTDAFVAYELAPDRFTVAGGRMVADSFQWLPIDGLSGTLHLDESTDLTLFGGRRAISSSRVNLGGFLPAVGGSFQRRHERYLFSAMASYAEDQFLLGTAGTSQTVDQGAFSSLIRTSLQAADPLWIGGQVSFAQRASYVLGTNRAQTTVELDVTGFSNAVAWASWRPTDWLRVDYDLHAQQAAFAYGGDGAADASLVDPNFVDNRLRLTGSHDIGAARADARLRLRPGRQERRLGGQLDAHRLVVPGLFARARAFVDDIVTDTPDTDDVAGTDRMLWSVSAGYDRNGLSLEAGASFIERAAVPVSGRVGNTVGAGALQADDLSPFVLEAQRIGFLRAFWVSRHGFVGADLERQLGDNEWRAYVQVGTFLERTW